MIQLQLKLRLTPKQISQLEGWLWNLTGVWNWAIKKIEADARDSVFYSHFQFKSILAGHGDRMGIPSHVLQGILSQAHISWSRCLKGISRRPHLKGARNKLSSIPFPDPIRPVIGNRITVPGLGKIRFYKQGIPSGPIKCGRIARRASGWYLCLFIAIDRKPIERLGFGRIGIDPGFNNLLTTSNGETVAHPREMEAAEKRIAQAQRGGNKALASRLQERRANRVKDRNHKLSLRLVQHNTFIAFSADSHAKVAKTFGRSVSSSSHYQLRQMLKYKSRSGDTEYVETDSRFSTMTCSICGALTGPTGLRGLAVRNWTCACGAQHDRDQNAAINVLNSGAGYALKESSNGLN
jgi:putative transposase